MSHLDPDREEQTRVRDNSVASSNRYALAKDIAGSDAGVQAEIERLTPQQHILCAVSCIPSTDVDADIISVVFHFSCGDQAVCLCTPEVMVGVSLSGRRVVQIERVNKTESARARTAFTPRGGLPFALATASAAQGVSADLSRVQEKRQREYDYFLKRCMITRSGYLPAGWLGTKEVPVNPRSGAAPLSDRFVPILDRPQPHISDAPCVLILAPTDDAAARVVRDEVLAMGYVCLLTDLAHYPSRTTLTWAIKPAGGRAVAYDLSFDGHRVTSERLLGVWWCGGGHEIPSDVVHAGTRTFCQAEAKAAFEGWLHGLGDRVINPRRSAEYAQNKVVQLMCAHEVGLRVPHTVTTNDQNAVQRWTALMRSVVFKTFSSPKFTLAETRRLREGDLANLTTLQRAPTIFQEEIGDKRDIRVFVVDEEVFAIEVVARLSGAELDPRLDPTATIVPHEIPAALRASLCRLARSLGLRYGAVDMGLTKEGYAFFEINPRGAFLFGEIHGGQNISAALARALVRPISKDPLEGY